ncbi:MAG: fluoride efflux transporter CrcB [Hyphomicrobium aestuarii]|mgnify:CR=1 FL=1|nr:fluoride efflux transporter CrcB [Hyphomicrobium aestuarii]
MQLLLLATLGGGIGAGARYLIQTEMIRRLGPGFPWWTLAINVAGCLLMGIIADLISRRFGGSPEARALLMTGVLGGFTTFSAFSLDVAQLVERRDMLAAAGYIGGSVILTIAALYLGIAIARTVVP